MDMGFNPVLVVTLLTWIITELTKSLVAVAQRKPRRLFDTGGMPSGHASITAALATSVGLQEGTDSAVFAVAVVLFIVVVHDAVRVRWSVGEQAVRLNQLAKRAKLPTVAVFRGHRIREIAVGAAYGGLLAWGLTELLQ